MQDTDCPVHASKPTRQPYLTSPSESTGTPPVAIGTFSHRTQRMRKWLLRPEYICGICNPQSTCSLCTCNFARRTRAFAARPTCYLQTSTARICRPTLLTPRGSCRRNPELSRHTGASRKLAEMRSHRNNSALTGATDPNPARRKEKPNRTLPNPAREDPQQLADFHQK